MNRGVGGMMEQGSDDLLVEDGLKGEFVDHAAEVVGNDGQVAPQLPSAGSDHLRHSFRLLHSYLLLPLSAHIGHHDDLAFADAVPVFSGARLDLAAALADAGKPTSEANQGYRQSGCDIGLEGEVVEGVQMLVVEVVDQQQLSLQMPQIGIGGVEVDCGDGLILTQTEDLEGARQAGADQHKSAAQGEQVGGELQVAVRHFFDFACGAVDSFELSVCPEAEEDMPGEEVGEDVLVLDGDVLGEASEGVEFPSDGVLVSHDQQQVGFRFDGFSVESTVHDELVGWHLVAHQQLRSAHTASHLPNLKAVAVVHHYDFASRVHPASTGVADLMFELPREFALRKSVEAQIGGDSPAHQPLPHHFQTHHVMTLPADLSAQPPLLPHQSDEGDLRV